MAERHGSWGGGFLHLGLAGLLALATACAPAEDADTEPTPAPTADPSPGADATADWASCSNTDDGYTIRYPADWATNTEPIDHVAPCSLFDPDPGQLRSEGMELPADIAVRVFVEAAPFADVAAGGANAEQLDRREDTVDGRAAVRTENEATGEGLYPQGWRYTVWAVDLEGTTFVANSFDVGEPAYTVKQDVLDAMVMSVRFEEGVLACSAHDLSADLQRQDGLPEAVADTREAIAAAAVRCDYEHLAELAGEPFTFSFGGGDDAAAHWRQEEARGGEPLRHLVELLDRPHATVDTPRDSLYVWPSAYAYDSWDEVPQEDREALRPLYDDTDFREFEGFGGYVGYRIAITADGQWRYFVAGD